MEMGTAYKLGLPVIFLVVDGAAPAAGTVLPPLLELREGMEYPSSSAVRMLNDVADAVPRTFASFVRQLIDYIVSQAILITAVLFALLAASLTLIPLENSSSRATAIRSALSAQSKAQDSSIKELDEALEKRRPIGDRCKQYLSRSIGPLVAERAGRAITNRQSCTGACHITVRDRQAIWDMPVPLVPAQSSAI
jgi:hypothetical protein